MNTGEKQKLRELLRKTQAVERRATGHKAGKKKLGEAFKAMTMFIKTKPKETKSNFKPMIKDKEPESIASLLGRWR